MLDKAIVEAPGPQNQQMLPKHSYSTLVYKNSHLILFNLKPSSSKQQNTVSKALKCFSSFHLVKRTLYYYSLYYYADPNGTPIHHTRLYAKMFYDTNT